MDAEKEMQEYSEKKMSRTRKIVNRVFSYIFRTIVFGIIALVLWRVFISDIVPSGAETLLVNEATYAAYLAEGESLTMYTQEQDALAIEERKETTVVDGVERETTVTRSLFWVCQTVFIPEADQVQLLTRYNNSTLRQLATDFKLDEVPSRDEEVVEVTLVVLTDPTPDEPDNGDSYKTRYHASGTPSSDRTLLYNYRKFIFDGVEIDAEQTVSVTAEFYYAGRVNYDRQPDNRLVIYDRETECVELSLSSADKKALRAYAEER